MSIGAGEPVRPLSLVELKAAALSRARIDDSNVVHLCACQVMGNTLSRSTWDIDMSQRKKSMQSTDASVLGSMYFPPPVLINASCLCNGRGADVGSSITRSRSLSALTTPSKARREEAYGRAIGTNFGFSSIALKPPSRARAPPHQRRGEASGPGGGGSAK